MTSPTPPRVRITSPRRDAARRSAAVRPSTREIDEDTGLGQVYMRTYLRGLRRLVAAALASLVTLLVGLPLAFALVPGAAGLRLGPGVTVAWLLVGVVIYPALWLLGRAYARAVERVERDFARTVAGDDLPDRDGAGRDGAGRDGAAHDDGRDGSGPTGGAP